jgi:hypothetical protein
MTLDEAFDEFQHAVNAAEEHVALARERRDTFMDGLTGEDDIAEVIASGALARRTQLDPIHDVDTIVVYRQEDHPDWGQPGESAEVALDHCRAQVKRVLGINGGTHAELVRLARWHNHAVKCFIDDPDDPDAFTVDAMPALRQDDGTLLVPEALSKNWIIVDPEYLITQVADRQRAWSFYCAMVRVLKYWRLSVTVTGKIKSLVIEILVLHCLPLDEARRSEALKRFFTAAAVRVNEDIEDPAGHCGPIQDDLDVAALRTALEDAADIAEQACTAADSGDTDEALRCWQKIFGPDFPAPEVKKLSPAVTAPVLITPRPVKDAPQG